jgi:gamma-butyrobetaine dioxygenase
LWVRVWWPCTLRAVEGWQMKEAGAVRLGDGYLDLSQPGGLRLRFADYWLRDNCRCRSCRHAGNGQKLYAITDLPADLSASEAAITESNTLRVLWSDGHCSEYPMAWLVENDLAAVARSKRLRQVELWDRGLIAQLPVADWPALLADPVLELGWLERYHALGFGLLRSVPCEPGTVAEVGDRLGFVRVTNYGRLFDVQSVPNPSNLAYTAVGLGVHSDNPYRHPSPGVQLLHCLESDAPGGDTLLIDGFHAAQLLRDGDPAAFDLLARVPMTFRYSDAATDLVARQTLISIDADGLVRAVHFNNRSADWLDAPAELAADWYRAYRKFALLLQRPELELVFRLNPGDCVVMQNDRTLHGRTAFDPGLGRRHLQGCYIDGDAMQSRRLVLRRSTGTATPHGMQRQDQ